MNKPPSATQIFIADDHPMVRDWLAQLINGEPGLTVCGEAADATQALQGIETLHPDMAIIDLTMEGSHGTDLIKDINTRYPELYVSELVEARILKEASAGHSIQNGLSVDNLSDREFAVFQLLGNGYGPSQIATELHLSVKTVEGYLARIKAKLLLKDARQLLQQAIQWNKLCGTGVPSGSPPQPQPDSDDPGPQN